MVPAVRLFRPRSDELSSSRKGARIFDPHVSSGLLLSSADAAVESDSDAFQIGLALASLNLPASSTVKAFISGGAGFIGSHLVSRLLDDRAAASITVYDNLTSGSRAQLERYLGDSRLSLVEGDIKDLELVTRAMSGCDTVFHLAANPDIAKAVQQPDIDFWEGTYLTSNILEAMRVNDVRVIIYTSGSGVYGDVPGVAFREDYGPCFPISTYGASKLACEGLISSYCHMFGMTGRAFRFANVVGPRQTHGVGYDFIRRLRANPSKLRILGDGTQRKSYIHVDDVLAAVFTVLHRIHTEAGPRPFDVYNVASEDYITVTEIARLACEVMSLDNESIAFEYTGGDRGWKGDVPQVLFNIDKISALGWKARRSSCEAMRASLQAMLDEFR
jgi:UDP-glucose 4-epimerase